MWSSRADGARLVRPYRRFAEDGDEEGSGFDSCHPDGFREQCRGLGVLGAVLPGYFAGLLILDGPDQFKCAAATGVDSLSTPY